MLRAETERGESEELDVVEWEWGFVEVVEGGVEIRSKVGEHIVGKFRSIDIIE